MGELVPPSEASAQDQTVLNLGPVLQVTSSGSIKINPSRMRQYPSPVDKSLPVDSPDQTFDDCRTIEGWTDLIYKLLLLAWKGDARVPDFKFTHDFALIPESPSSLAGVIIVYEIISEVPAQMGSRTEKKPRLRQVQPSPVYPGQQCWVYAQSFDVIVAFTVYGDSWSRASVITEKFKEFMLMYTGIFKQFGLQDLWYTGQMRDALYDPPKVQEFPNRTLFYKARIERQLNINYEEIAQVLISAGIVDSDTALDDYGIAQTDQAISTEIDQLDTSPLLPGADGT